MRPLPTTAAGSTVAPTCPLTPASGRASRGWPARCRRMPSGSPATCCAPIRPPTRLPRPATTCRHGASRRIWTSRISAPGTASPGARSPPSGAVASPTNTGSRRPHQAAGGRELRPGGRAGLRGRHAPNGTARRPGHRGGGPRRLDPGRFGARARPRCGARARLQHRQPLDHTYRPRDGPPRVRPGACAALNLPPD